MEAELSVCYAIHDFCMTLLLRSFAPSLLPPPPSLLSPSLPRPPFLLSSPLPRLPYSGSSCSLAAGLESLGLTDIRTLVRLMCLAAAGRAGLSTSPTAGSGHAERPRGAAKASKPISCLAYLSTAVGCLASNSPNAAKLLVQLCTQVHSVTHQPGSSFRRRGYNYMVSVLKSLGLQGALLYFC